MLKISFKLINKNNKFKVQVKKMHLGLRIRRNMYFYDEFNVISNTLSMFLMVLTFFKTPMNVLFDELIFNLFIVFSEFLGSYTYRAIGYNLRLTSLLKKATYIRRFFQANTYKTCIQLRFAAKQRVWFFTKNIIRNLTRFNYLKYYEKKLNTS